MMKRKKIKTTLQRVFEVWAKDHKFNCDWDADLGLYVSAFTQGAWIAYREADEKKENKNGN